MYFCLSFPFVFIRPFYECRDLYYIYMYSIFCRDGKIDHMLRWVTLIRNWQRRIPIYKFLSIKFRYEFIVHWGAYVTNMGNIGVFHCDSPYNLVCYQKWTYFILWVRGLQVCSFFDTSRTKSPYNWMNAYIVYTLKLCIFFSIWQALETKINECPDAAARERYNVIKVTAQVHSVTFHYQFTYIQCKLQVRQYGRFFSKVFQLNCMCTYLTLTLFYRLW